MEREPDLFNNENMELQAKEDTEIQEQKKEMIERWKRVFAELERIINEEKKIQEERTKEKLRKKTISEVEEENEILRSGDLVFLPSKGKCLFIGDLHGDCDSLNAILEETKFKEELEKETGYLVFLGDYIDRGNQEIEVLERLLELKKLYGERVILLRGNHESLEQVMRYGPKSRPSGLIMGGAFEKAQDFFESLPCILVTGNGVCALHGGVPEIKQEWEVTLDTLSKLKSEERDQVLWNDPAPPDPREAGLFQEDYGDLLFLENKQRRDYKFFTPSALDNFLKSIGAKVLIRGHEAVENGYLIHFFYEDKLATIFSSLGTKGYEKKVQRPGYCLLDLREKIDFWKPEYFKNVQLKKENIEENEELIDRVQILSEEEKAEEKKEREELLEVIKEIRALEKEKKEKIGVFSGFSWEVSFDFLKKTFNFLKEIILTLKEIILTSLEWIINFTDKVLDFLIQVKKFYDENIKEDLKKIWKELWK